MSPLIAHVPHGSTVVPPDVRETLRLTDAELSQEILRLTDWYVDELFSCITEMGGTYVVYPVSRVVLDPERFDDDEQEVMASRGMGVIYTRTSEGKELRAPLSHGERQALLDRFYQPHHAALEQAVDVCLNRFGRCLILDCHSFSSTPLPFELDQDPIRPDICLGTDPFHTPSAVINFIEQFFRAQDWTVYLDKPYKGTMVPLKHYGKDRRVLSSMLELNRRLYMNEETGEKLPVFEEVKHTLERLCRELIDTALP